MDNQYKQEIDFKETDGKSLLSQDAADGVANVSQVADPDGIQTRFSSVRFLIIMMGGIFLAEVIAMIFVSGFPRLPYYLQVIIDASIMLVLIFPLVYYFSLRPVLLYIEKHQRLGNALRQSEERFALAYRSNPAALSITRVEDGRFIDVNDSFLCQSGYARDEVIGHTSDELNLYPNSEEFEKLKWLLLKQKNVDGFEMTTRIKSGEIRNISVSTEAIELGGEVNILAVASDITERKLATKLVERERQRFYDVLESLPAYLVLLTPDYHVSFANRFFREQFGENQGQPCYEYLFGRNEPCETCKTYKILNTRMPERWEWNGPDDHVYDVSNFPFNDVDGSTLILQVGIDVTEQKRAEARLQRVNHALSVLKECNEILVRAENETELLQQMCEIIVTVGEYRMAWVGFAEQDQNRSVRPDAQFGFEDGYLGLAHITWADDEYGLGPTGTAIREGVTQVNQNFQTNPKMEPWRASAISRGYQSSIALPLKDESSTFGALTIYSASPDAFDEDEVDLLNELAGDLAFGITALRVRVERKQAQEQIREMALLTALNPDVVLRVDTSGRIERTNPAANQMGFYVGAQLTEILPDLLDLDLPACIAPGNTHQVQLEARLGEQVLLCTVRGVPDLGLAFLYGKDITQRKRAEAEIRQLSRIVEQTEDTVVVTDRKGLVEYVNPAFERLTGFTKDEALGKTPAILKSGLHDEEFYITLWNTILGGNVFLGEVANRRKNGELFYEVKTITPLRDSQGQITHFVATGKDITTHKLDEEKLRKTYDELELRVKERTEELVAANTELKEEIKERERIEAQLTAAMSRLEAHIDNSPLAVVEFDPEFHMTRWSKAAERIFGWTAEEVVGHSIAEMNWVYEEDVEAVARLSGDMLDGRRSRNLNVNRNHRKDGTVIDCEWYNSALYDAQGQLTSIMAQVLDITERRRAEEALHKNEATLRGILNATKESIWLFSPDGIILTANETALLRIGMPAEEVIGEPFKKFMPLDLAQLRQTYLREAAESGQPFEVEDQRAGIIFHHTYYPVKDANGQVVQIAAFSRDITERKKVEDALRLSEMDLRNAQEVAHIGNWKWNLDTREITWSDEMYRIFGIDKDSYTGRLGDVISNVIHPDDLHLVLPSNAQALAEKNPIEYRIILPDKSIHNIWAKSGEAIVDDKGKPIFLTGIAQDITERKRAEESLRESEEKYKKLVKYAPAAIYEMDMQGTRFLSVNEVMCDILRYSREELLSIKPMDLLDQASKPLFSERIKRKLAGENLGETIEYRVRRKDGEWIYTDINVGSITFTGKDPASVVVIGHDVTERKRMEEALRLSEERFRLALRNAPVTVATQDNDLYFTWAYNQRSVRPEDVIGKTDFDLFPPETAARLVTLKRQVLESGTDVKEQMWVASGGLRVYLDIYLEPIRNEDEQIIGVGIATVDLTERKQAEDALQHRNVELEVARAAAENERRRLEAVMETLPVGVAILDTQGGNILANQAYEQVWGSPLPAVDSISDYPAYKAWWVDSGQLVQPEEWASAQAVQKGKSVIGQLMQIERFDGNRAYVLNSGVPIFDDQRQITGSAVAILDITELKQAEEALRKAHDELELRVLKRTEELAAVNRELMKEVVERREVERQLRTQTTAMEAAANGILITDPKGIIQWTNPALAQITGYSASELLGQSTRIFNSGKHSADYYRQMWNTIYMGQIWRGETINRRKDNSLYVEEQTITPVRDEHDQIQHFIAIKQDITERKQAELELAKRNVELQALSTAEHEQRQLSEALVQAALVLNKSMRLDEVLPLILEKIKEVIPYHLANIAMLDGEAFYDASHQGDPRWSNALAGIKNRFPLEDFHLLTKMIHSGQPLLIRDIQNEPQWISANGLEWCRSYLSAPLLAENQVIGFVNLFAEQPDFFTTEMQNRLVAFASHAAVAIQNAWLFGQVRASSDRLQSLSHRLVEIQENERLYIARELHDEAGQMLTSLMLDLRMLETRAYQPEAVLKKISEMELSLNAVSENLHNVAMALRPASLDHLGLVPALRQYVESVGEKYGLKASFRSGKFNERLPANMETELYRIVQEALTNVVRHAHASQVDVILTIRDGKLIVIVEDDGDGFDPQKVPDTGHLGLFGIKERTEMIGGKLVIESAPEKGTTVIVEVNYVDSIVDRRRS